MCVPIYSLLLFTLTTIIFCGTMMVTEGLPLGRQERGVDRGVLTGDDFLSVFLKSSLSQDYKETSTSTSTKLTTSLNQSSDKLEDTSLQTTIDETTTEEITTTGSTTVISELHDVSSTTNVPASDSKTSVVVAVRVSSSVDKTLNNTESRRNNHHKAFKSTTEIPDQNLVASEEHPVIVAGASKSEFSVDEREPITTNTDSTSREVERGYPASVQPLPRNSHSHFNPNAGFLSQDEGKAVHPLHHTVIYHNNPRDSGRARSVSYSTVIQSVPHLSGDKTWGDEKLIEHGRRERNYDGVQPAFGNTFREVLEKNKATSTPLPTRPKSDKGWGSTATTERNWEVQQKPYSPSRRFPTVYGVPEKNYEVDESASVMTNGRLHGVQFTPTAQPSKQRQQEIKIGESKKTDDNQKIGYVVEGRNYRKYRVEERTSDGFIVGEYGVVSHDDGSLRGVRYTADGTTNPRLIYDALMKFLSL